MSKLLNPYGKLLMKMVQRTRNGDFALVNVRRFRSWPRIYRLVTTYQKLHDAVHAKSGQASPLKLIYISTEHEACLVWVSTYLPKKSSKANGHRLRNRLSSISLYHPSFPSQPLWRLPTMLPNGCLRRKEEYSSKMLLYFDTAAMTKCRIIIAAASASPKTVFWRFIIGFLQLRSSHRQSVIGILGPSGADTVVQWHKLAFFSEDGDVRPCAPSVRKSKKNEFRTSPP